MTPVLNSPGIGEFGAAATAATPLSDWWWPVASTLFPVVALLLLLVLLCLIRLRERRRERATRRTSAHRVPGLAPVAPAPTPIRWLAVRTEDTAAVQAALGVHHARVCRWSEAVRSSFEPRLFIAPPVEGWVLVLGCDLPDPSRDVDRCFHFLRRLSASLGDVQFFSVNRLLSHHAWVWMVEGYVRRAYAWGGATLWQEGPVTEAERALGLRCLEYGQDAREWGFERHTLLAVNTQKVPQLSARWSLDPARLDPRLLRAQAGIVGRLPAPRTRV